MPRIRKKTSKRGTTNERRKIHNKVRESKKKKSKQARKNPNPQWKSKHKKDPGIPSNFPFKDQILAEVAEQRRLAAEEKQRRKDAKKTLQSQNPEEGDGTGSESEDNDNDIEDIDVDDEDFQGIATIGAKRLLTAKTATKPVLEVEEDEEDVPILINRDLPNLRAVLDQADIVVQVLDARDPLSFRSSEVEELVQKNGKKMVFVLNKIDTCPQESVAAWASALRKEHPTFLFRSASSCLPGNPLIPASVKAKGKGKAKDPSDDAVGLESVLEYLGQLAEDKESTTIAVVGISNVGKSSFVNSLLKKTSLPVYSLSPKSQGPSTTTLPHDVTLDLVEKKIRIIDTPGLMWQVDKAASDAEEARARDILLRNKGRIDRLKDPAACVSHIVSRSSAEDLMLLYSLPTFIKGDLDSFLSGMARSQQLVRKKGALDLTAASKTVLRDWSIGKIHWYSSPPGKQSSAERGGLYEKDSTILSTLQPRKVLRKAVGLVRLSPGEVDSRKPAFERLYEEEEDDHDDSSDEEEGDASMEVDGDNGDEEEEVELEEDEEEMEGEETQEGDEEPEEQVPLLSKKQKRKRAAETVLPPSKKVAFASSVKSKASKPISASSQTSVKIRSALKTRPKGKKVPATSQKVAWGDEAYDFGKFF